jgi:branched-chain amino acid transport system permease protein
MIVLGGLGSVNGAVLGALFVSALPLVFQRYADAIPFVGGQGEGGLAAGEAARFLFGAAIVLVILFEPAGLAGIARRLTRRGGGAGGRATSPPGDAPSRPTSPDPSEKPAQGSPT